MISLYDSPFLAACRSEPHDHTPVWFMRQAGRSLPEYRKIRGEGSILDAIKDAELSAEITLQPVHRYNTDAAILYSDIVVPLHALGFGVEIQPGIGPVVENPFRSIEDLKRLRPLDPDSDTPYVLETIQLLVEELAVPLIGFAGAPFTLASYLIEGAPSRTYTKTKALMMNDPELWDSLMSRLVEIVISSLRSQISAGVSAIQLFDSWAGALSPSAYERFVLPYTKEIFSSIQNEEVPTVHFGVGTGEILHLMASAGSSVMGVDWRTPLDVARDRLGSEVALQGNLDPAICFASENAISTEVRNILEKNAGHPGHIFNLGHGVLPETDPKVLERIVEQVHSYPLNSAEMK
ncbi:MAG: uroporphyrinogen decarboxylase [marine actinobacterium MedAcidi-G2B]|nr:MAG: uroporphyrinogen decarboxylase [marine actinobacterium MedAcidi-G2B]